MKDISSTVATNRVTRRDFLKITAGVGRSAASMSLLEACRANPTAPTTAADRLETTTIRFHRSPSICIAPLYLAEDFLKAEGFTDVQYVTNPNIMDSLASGEIDLAMQFAAPIISYLDTGKPLTVLAGIHVGCFELFGAEGVNVITDLKGKTVVIAAVSLGSTDYAFLSTILSYIGLNPNIDVNWIPIRGQHADPLYLFIRGKSDAYLAFPPKAQELKAKKIGHVVLNSMMDKPWSQYYCCMMISNSLFAQNNPVATKRALRAILKATDTCAAEPERAAKLMVDERLTYDYEYALAAMKQIRYNVWRDYDPEDTLRFYALRLRELGLIQSSPDEIIAKGTDWRFLNELKMELKA
jgi:NitT/TauT family transport system substrate-binding protein